MHNIKLTYLTILKWSEALNTFTLLCYHHHYHLRPFSSFPAETVYPLHTNSQFPLTLEITIPLCVSMHSSTLGTSYKCNHTIFIFSCQANFTWRDVFNIHPCCSVGLNFLPFEEPRAFYRS